MLQRHTVKKIDSHGRRAGFWIFTPEGKPHPESRRVLWRHPIGTQQTYAYALKDHLDWLSVNHRVTKSITMADLQLYMAALTGSAAGISGVAWRSRPLGSSASKNVATIVRDYYLHLDIDSVNPDLISELRGRPNLAGKLGRTAIQQSNPIAPRGASRQPRIINPSSLEALELSDAARSDRDRMILVWLERLGLRIGELCGLRTEDLHFSEEHACGQRLGPHVHIIAREDNPNGARAKQRLILNDHEVLRKGIVTGGIIRTVDVELINAYYTYHLNEYRHVTQNIDHTMVLVHLSGRTPGAPLTTQGARKAIERILERAEITEHITPHSFRHLAASRLYASTNYNAELVAQEFGWSDPQMVTDTYGKSANYQMMSHLNAAWNSILAQPPTSLDEQNGRITE